MEQISIFDGNNKLLIDKPIRLVELFGGYGSQALALKYLGVPFEHHALSEWAVKSIQAYKDMHSADDNSDYSETLSADEIRGWLLGRISTDYSTPMTEKQIARLTDQAVRQIYNNMMATKNLGSIMAINGPDLNITDTDKYCYIMTYSFPCQDLSSAGKGMGMARGSGTRSGLLWEVERLLKEMDELPQILLMENVPEVIRAKNMPHFAEWVSFLDSLGYKTKTQILNTKHFGIPQNRERCFAVSFLGDYYYDTPQGFPLDKRLKDILETNVDESYYLKDATLNYFISHSEEMKEKGNGFRFEPTNGDVIAKAITTRAGGGWMTILYNEQAIVYSANATRILRRSCSTVAGNLSDNNRVVEPTTRGSDCASTIRASIHKQGERNLMENLKNGRGYEGVIEPTTTDYRVRKLTEKECFRLQGVKDEDFERVRRNQSKSSCYHLAGDSITTSVLMALFGEMLNLDWRTEIENLAEELTKG